MPNHGLIRSAFSGQGNAITLAPEVEVISRHLLELNPAGFRREQAEALDLDRRARRAWARERRIAQAVRLVDGGRSVFLVNMHCTSYPSDERIPDVELRRAADWATSTALPEDVVVLAGDFNVRPGSSETLEWLASPAGGFSPPGPGIDHVLVKGAAARPLLVWPDDRRLRGGRLLSDHAPVEVEIP
jgi:endonuclease/exonuclease/phosphatase family metal-dependent hydrolase